jgi:hypothetical protein
VKYVLSLALLFASCGVSDNTHESGFVTGSRSFRFRNFTELRVESEVAPFRFEDYGKPPKKLARAPFAELRVWLASGEVVATDHEVEQGALKIGGRVYTGAALLLRGDGTVEPLRTFQESSLAPPVSR